MSFCARHATAAAVIFFAAPPIAFAQQSGLVVVDISKVADSIAQSIKVDPSRIPLTVQVPVHVAAAVCGIAADVLVTQAVSGRAECAAQTTSAALNDAVQGQVKKG